MLLMRYGYVVFVVLYFNAGAAAQYEYSLVKKKFLYEQHKTFWLLVHFKQSNPTVCILSWWPVQLIENMFEHIPRLCGESGTQCFRFCINRSKIIVSYELQSLLLFFHGRQFVYFTVRQTGIWLHSYNYQIVIVFWHSCQIVSQFGKHSNRCV